MNNIPRHKVFISFQHGCEDSLHSCGKNAILLPWEKVSFFNECKGSCGRNLIHCSDGSTKCKFYFKCGHYWKERFEFLMTSNTEKMISKAVQDGDIHDGINTERTRQIIRDNYIADATVTVVLIGPETWKRRHVDWEISSSIKDTKNNSRCGLIGIFLPTNKDFGKEKYTYTMIPPRLYYNVKSGFASLHDWTENTDSIQNWIHEAFLRKDKERIDNSYQMFSNNRSNAQNEWQP